MIVPLWAAELADAFWEAAGMREEFPRSLRRPIVRALQMALVSLPRLRLRDVRAWLEHHGFSCPCRAADRRLHGFLLAQGGWGYVFLDGEDTEDEQRLSLAHELAHFLRHYWYPRREITRTLGVTALEVLDGRRPATEPERTRALLASVPVGVHWHLLAREEAGGLPRLTVRAAEEEADRLAYELLAPAEEVASRTDSPQIGAVAELLRNHFRLPAGHAQRYAEILVPQRVNDPFWRHFGLA